MARLLLCALLSATSSFYAIAAHAQAAASPAEAASDVGNRLQDIIVTARKREETLQDVPVAVSAVGGEQLRRALANDLNKMAELAPQVSIGQGGTGTGAVITVRGVSSGSNDAGLDQSVAIEFDNVPLSRGHILAAALFDIEQVQVLQGPQALFFGKNSPAGVISISSANPTDRFEGYVNAGYEFEARQKYVEGAVSGPFSNSLRARVAARISDMRGWLKNVAQSRPDILNPAVTIPAPSHRWGPANQDVAIRGTLVWAPSTDFEANLKATYNTQKRTFASSEPFCIAPTTSPVFLGTRPLPDSDCKKNRETTVGSVPAQYRVNAPYTRNGDPYYSAKIALLALTMKKDFDVGSITSTTGYYDQITQQLNSADQTSYATIWFPQRDHYKITTQELRFDTELDGPLNFMIGGYYEHFSRKFYNAPDLFHTFNPQAGNYFAVEMESLSKGTYISAFAQARWNILDNLELSGGARWSSDEKTLDAVNTQVGPGQIATVFPRGVHLKSKFKDQHISPEVTLTWHPAPGQTLYGAYKTGYKGGGISNAFLIPKSSTPENIQFQPETAEGFEVGYKATAMDRRLRFDVTAYNYKYGNLQVVSYNASTISFVLQNAASARIKGVQGSVAFLATEGLTLRGNLGYNSAKYINFANAPCYLGQTAATGCSGTPAAQNLAGKALLRAPKLTYSIGADYKAPLSNTVELNLGVQGTHTSSYQTATDYAPAGFQKAYWILNASAGLGFGEGKYEIAVIGRNLTNSYYMLNSNGQSGSGNPNQQVGFFNRPREVALQASMRF